jgi:carboxypeptidase C (cathepsin A)
MARRGFDARPGRTTMPTTGRDDSTYLPVTMRRAARLAGATTVALAWLALAPRPATAADEPPSAAAKPASPEGKQPAAEQSVTKHQLLVDRTKIPYTATAGTLVVRDDQQKPIASIGYVYYERDGAERGRRPLVFAFNGGPGSSSIWLHMGVLGPKRVVAVDAGVTPPPPYSVVDNAYGVLDVADLVMIDPVGTGISAAVGEKKDEDFWGVDPDIDSVGRFIAQFVGERGRWNSPKYLLGESYGTTRAAGVAHWLQQHAVALNGVVLVSVALDVEALFAEIPGNERPYPLFLPSFALTALRHGLVHSDVPRDAFLAEVRDYARGPYLAALMRGDSLPAAERDAVAAKLSSYTGLSVDYLKAANLRVSENMFNHELLKSRRQTVARLDSRFTGVTLDPLVRDAEYDPQSTAISAAYAAAFNDWWREGLKFGAGRQYRPMNGEIYGKWKWSHQTDLGPQPFANTGVDLKLAMVENPGLRVLVLNGMYDLATPFSATEYMIDHLGLPPGFREHVTMKYYDAGHMMYVNPDALAQMKRDLDAFFSAVPGR